MKQILIKRYAVHGLGVERLLDTLQRRGIQLDNIRRVDLKTAEFACSLRNENAVRQIAASLGFSLEPLPLTGVLYRMQKIKRNRALWAVAALAGCMLFLSLQFIWVIRVEGAGIYAGEIRQWLQANSISPGMLRHHVDTSNICGELMYLLPKVSWVRARTTGVYLTIEVTQGTSVRQEEIADTPGALVAAQDGIVESIQVYSGTPAVKPGDTVQKGDVLIYGTEKGLYGESQRPVRARGSILARTWIQAAASAAAFETDSIPTGRSSEAKTLSTPWYSLQLSEPPDYLTSDKAEFCMPIGGAWFPIWTKRTEYVEVSLEKRRRNMEEAQAEAGALAMRNLLLLQDEKNEMIDKWLFYSMIDGDTILATATAEQLSEIGSFLPQTMD